MSDELFHVLVGTTIATSVAVVMVSVLRKPVRIAAGARVAYWLWPLVPALAVAVLLPAPKQDFFGRAAVVPGHIRSALAADISGHVGARRRTALVDVVLAIWAGGIVVSGALTIRRQRLLSPILRSADPDTEGFHRGDVAVPMLVGAWRPKIVVPRDFEARFSKEERELILAHERAHACRHDVAANGFGSSVLCVYWFNPLMYRALGLLRMDQELACDAHVLTERGDARRKYAETLLKTQLATESAWRLSPGCHWQSIHPLKERVAMLKRPFPVRTRRLAGVAFVAAIVGVTTYATWAAQPSVTEGPRVWIDYKLKITTLADPHYLVELDTKYVVASGEVIKDDKDGEPLLNTDYFRLGCTPYLPDETGRSADWSDQKARGIPIPNQGQILLECTIQHKGGATQNATVLAKDSNLATIDTAEPGGSYQYHLEVIAYSKIPAEAAAAGRLDK